MKLRDFALLTDENLDPDVVAFLHQTGFDLCDVCDNGMQGSTDVDLLRRAFTENRVIVTLDADFGILTVLGGEPVVGILYLRPGHIDPRFTIETIETVLKTDPDVAPPFLIVAKRTGKTVAIRIRALPP